METMWITAVVAILIAMDTALAGRQKAKTEIMQEKISRLESEAERQREWLNALGGEQKRMKERLAALEKKA